MLLILNATGPIRLPRVQASHDIRRDALAHELARACKLSRGKGIREVEGSERRAGEHLSNCMLLHSPDVL